MPDLFINGVEGKLEARYHKNDDPEAPVALFLHPHPLYGGTMNNKVVYNMFHTYVNKGFSCIRFNFRGVGRSQGNFAMGDGELTDAATMMDWLLENHKQARQRWIVGFSFGSWIAMQLLMRRPEVTAFICVAPPTNMYDFNFLAPCQTAGLIIQGTSDIVVPPEHADELYQKLLQQKGIDISMKKIDDADHFFVNHMDSLCQTIDDYIIERKDDRTQTLVLRYQEHDDFESLDDDDDLDDLSDDDNHEFEEIEEGII